MYPPPINHRSLEHHYTKSLGHDDIKSDVPTSGVPPSPPSPWLSNLVVQSTIRLEPYYTEEALPC